MYEPDVHGRPALEIQIWESSELRWELKVQVRMRRPGERVYREGKARKLGPEEPRPAWLGRGGCVCQGKGGEMAQEAEGR